MASGNTCSDHADEHTMIAGDTSIPFLLKGSGQLFGCDHRSPPVVTTEKRL